MKHPPKNRCWSWWPVTSARSSRRTRRGEIVTVMKQTGRTLPTNHRTSLVFVDESGSASNTPVLAVGAIKFPSGHGRLITELQQFRDRSGWRGEAHFNEAKRLNAHLYREAVRILAASDARFSCVVIDRTKYDPFRGRREPWKTHAQLTIALLVQAIAGDEIVSATIDHLSMPPDVNYEGYIRAAVNKQKGRLALATVCRMDSRACWGIQLADVLTGAVAHQYRQRVDGSVTAGSPRGQLAAFIAEQFNLGSLVAASSQRFAVREQVAPTRARRNVRVLHAMPPSGTERSAG